MRKMLPRQTSKAGVHEPTWSRLGVQRANLAIPLQKNTCTASRYARLTMTHRRLFSCARDNVRYGRQIFHKVALPNRPAAVSNRAISYGKGGGFNTAKRCCGGLARLLLECTATTGGAERLDAACYRCLVVAWCPLWTAGDRRRHQRDGRYGIKLAPSRVGKSWETCSDAAYVGRESEAVLR